MYGTVLTPVTLLMVIGWGFFRVASIHSNISPGDVHNFLVYQFILVSDVQKYVLDVIYSSHYVSTIATNFRR